MSQSIKILSKVITIEISNKLQPLLYDGIRRDRESAFIINNSCVAIINIGKWWSKNTNQIAVFARKTAFY